MQKRKTIIAGAAINSLAAFLVARRRRGLINPATHPREVFRITPTRSIYDGVKLVGVEVFSK